MPRRAAAVLLVALLSLLSLLPILSGCATLKGGKLLAPQQAEAVVSASFGSVASRPSVHACFSASCLVEFGGEGNFAKVYGERILLSARGANWQFSRMNGPMPKWSSACPGGLGGVCLNAGNEFELFHASRR